MEQITMAGLMPELETLINGDECQMLVDGEWKKVRVEGNTSDSPTNPIKSKLSDILEHNVDEKYRLSEKACQGILRRAESRGKELPVILKSALLSTAGIKEEEVASSTTFSKTAHPRNAEEGQGWEKSDTAHTLNQFCIGEMRADELVVQH